MTEREWRYLGALFGSWAHHVGGINETYGSRLEALPNVPTPEELEAGNIWILPLVETCDSILVSLAEEGIMELLEVVKNAEEAGEPIPKDFRRKAVGLHNAWVEMFTWLRPKAVNWATRLWEVVEADRGLDRKAREWAERLGSAADASN